jgi:hypothetical protein
MPLIYGPF